MCSVTEGLPVGRKFRSQGRTIGEGDFSLLTNITWTTRDLHSNREYMKETQFGERLLAGPCVLAVAIGLSGRGELMFELDRAGVRIVAMLGFENVRFTGPVLPGDTLTVDSELLDARVSKNPERGVMRVREVASKQTGEEVMEAVRSILFERKS